MNLPDPTPLPDTKITELETELKEKENKYLYLYAEFDNFKKRTQKERIELVQFGWEKIAHELLQVSDNLERAIEHSQGAALEGLQMVLTQFKNILEKNGIRPLETIHKIFDPNLHEAVGMEPSDFQAQTIIYEHTKGYRLHDRLLRPARVTLSQGPKTTEVPENKGEKNSLLTQEKLEENS